jgi:hypothetical protein
MVVAEESDRAKADDVSVRSLIEAALRMYLESDVDPHIATEVL